LIFKKEVKGYSEKVLNPLFRTTNMDYGAKKPNVDTVPKQIFSKSSAFTEVSISYSIFLSIIFNIFLKIKIYNLSIWARQACTEIRASILPYLKAKCFRKCFLFVFISLSEV
jgi:hypothetical protein